MFHLNRGNWVFEDATVASGLAQSGSVYHNRNRGLRQRR